ncbi:hypothetical protein TTHERM_00765090 (macronuclear) [Tetrahymena thermophila SB210]|uniref:Uncharacterized protein n=1 Tax=Tetrahymena thermophila (strain SB210) TaxID=312017 RepID=I7MML2_TETTS|nr:hypothetical protein TTHERM_00765090 [Tetrahymena thermophila SB210]EAS05124.2 hypothetical protein TTHERM_00765090 [Tetrahymena thermophila SB210]|eukprot:XP_001025369.2 hypothetical protein TTHERM_00765090 [Tetrahymena thermophila SB210]
MIANKNQIKPMQRYEMNKNYLQHLERMNKIKQRKNETLSNVSYSGHPNEVHKRNREIERLNNIQLQNQNILSRLIKITVGGASFDHHKNRQSQKASSSIERKSNDINRLELDYNNQNQNSINSYQKYLISSHQNTQQQQNSYSKNDMLKVSSCPNTPRQNKRLNIETEHNSKEIHLPAIASSVRNHGNQRYGSVNQKNNPYKLDDLVKQIDQRSRRYNNQNDDSSNSSTTSIKNSNRQKVNSSLDTYGDSQRNNKLKYHIKFSENQPQQTQFKEIDQMSSSLENKNAKEPSDHNQKKITQIKKKQPLIIEEIDWKDVQNQQNTLNYQNQSQFVKTKSIELDEEKDTIFTTNAKILLPSQQSQKSIYQNNNC